MKRLKKLLLLAILLILVVCIYAFGIEPHRFVVYKENITLDDGKGSFSMVQISDTEIGKYYKEGNLRKHIEDINALSPDIIVFTGDLFTNYATYGPYEEVRDILSQLKARGGKYAVYGNKDYGGGAVRIYESLMQEAGFTILRNEVEQLTIQGQEIQLVGVDSYLMGELNMETITQQLRQGITTIVLAHEPEIIEEIPFYFDLIVCGHTHGGQVAISALQKMFHISNTPYQKGLYTLHDRRQVYVDSGMGTSRIPIRFLNPPQVSYITISL